MKLMFLVIIVLYSCFSFGKSIEITGKAPYYKTKTNLSKMLAIEDALFNASLLMGGEVDSRWSLTNTGHLKGGVRIKNFLKFKQIQIEKCARAKDQLICSLKIELIANMIPFSRDFETNKGDCKLLNGQKQHEISECYNVKELSVSKVGQLIKITGIQQIFIYRDGITRNLLRYSKKEGLVGLGRTLESAKRSLLIQGEGMFREWLSSEERSRLIFEETLLDSFIFAVGSCNYECMISKGIYPIEIHSYGRKVLILGKRLRLDGQFPQGESINNR